MSIFTRDTIYFSADRATFLRFDPGTGLATLTVNGTAVWQASSSQVSPLVAEVLGVTGGSIGFYGTTPVTRPHATAESLVATTAITPVATTAITTVITTAATSTTPFGFATAAQADAIRAAVNSLIAQSANDVVAANSLITQGNATLVLANQLQADLVTLGLIKGSN